MSATHVQICDRCGYEQRAPLSSDWMKIKTMDLAEAGGRSERDVCGLCFQAFEVWWKLAREGNTPA